MMLYRKTLIRELDTKDYTASGIEAAVLKASEAAYDEFRSEQSGYQIISVQVFNNGCGELMVLFNCESQLPRWR